MFSRLAVAVVGGMLMASTRADVPVCVHVGTRSEGWAWNGGRFIRWAKCEGVTPVCRSKGDGGEGWYARGVLIVAAPCAHGGPAPSGSGGGGGTAAPAPEPVDPDR
jgi:hypothetical protein